MANGVHLNGNAKAALEIGFKVLITLYVPLLIWMGGLLIGISNRVTAIEANRFTSNDGTEIWQALAVRPTFDQVPPEWLVADIQEIKDDIAEIQRLLRETSQP